jgi:PST family polysaccharide transporter
MAFAGAGAWSLAAGQVLGAAVTAALLFIRSPIPVRFRWDSSRVPGLLRFGLPLMLAGAFNQLILNTDFIVVNRYLSLSVAGAYFVVFNVSNWPVTLISFAMRRTAMAGFSRLQDDAAALQRAFERSIQLLVTATLPMAALIGILAREVILFLFGPKWLAGTTALRFLAGISVIRLVFSLCLDLLAAKGRTMVILWVQILWFVALLAGLWWGVTRHELVGVGMAQLGAALFVALPLLTACLTREGIRVTPVLPLMVRPLLGGLALIAACLVARSPFENTFVRLMAGSVAGLAAYGAIALPGTPLGHQLLKVWNRTLTRVPYRRRRVPAHRRKRGAGPAHRRRRAGGPAHRRRG